MQNLTATSLWELARVAYRVFRFRRGIDSGAAEDANRQPMDGGEDLTTVMLAAINLLRNRSGEITLRSQRSRYQKTELTIKLTDESESSGINSNASCKPCHALTTSARPKSRIVRLVAVRS
jgi:hypothetical protein